jgi:phosphatidate cytidylyltransferase
MVFAEMSLPAICHPILTAHCRLHTAYWSYMARILSALTLVAIAIPVVRYAPPVLFFIGIGLTGTLCLYEYFGLIRSMGVKIQPVFCYAAFWFLLAAFHYSDYFESSIPNRKHFGSFIPITLVLLAAFLSAMWSYRQPMRDRALALMAELLGILYLSLFLYPAVPLRFDVRWNGLYWFLFLLIVVWTNDTAALAVGKTLGRRRLAPVLSPKKTWEGAIGGLLAGIGIAAAIHSFLFPDLPIHFSLIASALVGIFGQLGDLAESMLKRAAAIKDSSHLIPGHGGVLDRMDSLLFAIPVLYFYLILLYR